MKVAVLHSEVPQNAPKDEQDNLQEIEFVVRTLNELGHETFSLPFSISIRDTVSELKSRKPDLVFNLVETIGSKGQYHFIVPAVLESIGVPYTGATSEALFLTSSKTLSKETLRANNIPTPEWVSEERLASGGGQPLKPPYIIKAVWEDASFGLDDSAIFYKKNRLRADMKAMREKLKSPVFAEAYIEGKEVNIALIAGEKGPETLPPAWIQFIDYPEGKPKIVGYQAKWEEGSFEFNNTQRSFAFEKEERAILKKLIAISKQCWNIFSLRGYARVDFRVDANGTPYVLELNANPGIAPDSGFVMALKEAGIQFKEALSKIIADCMRNYPNSFRSTPASVSEPPISEEEIRFREDVRANDFEAVRNLARESGNFSCAEIEVAAELVQERLSKGAASGYDFLIAEKNGQFLGYTCYGLIPGTKTSYEIYWIVVAKAARRMGLGGILMKKTEEKIQNMGGRRALVHTSSREDYASTRSFYEHRGYALAANFADYYDDGDHCLVYEHRL